MVLGAAFLVFSYLLYIIRANSKIGWHLSGVLMVFHGLFSLLVGPMQENFSKQDVVCCVISGLFAVGLATKVLAF
jgi:hypothetical protein